MELQPSQKSGSVYCHADVLKGKRQRLMWLNVTVTSVFFSQKEKSFIFTVNKDQSLELTSTRLNIY